MVPELPAYLTSLGGEDYKGLIIGLFTVAALISRPFSGKLADTIGRIPVIVIGTGVCVVLGVIYPFISTVGGFLLLRFLHGFSTGFQPTGTTAYLADVIPFHKRGEAMGYLGVSGTLGMSGGPALGGFISNQFGLDFTFYASACSAVLSLIVLAGIKETVHNKQKFSFSHLAVWRETIIDKNVMPAFIVMFLTVFSFGMILTIIPDFSDHLGIGNRGIFFSVFTVASILSRVIAGKASDIYGRVKVLYLAILTIAFSMAIIATAESGFQFYLGAVLFGFGTGMNSPTIFAWTVDLSDGNNRARSIATVFMGLEAGIFSGSVFPMFVYQNDPGNFMITFLLGTGTCLLALIYLLVFRVRG